MQRAVLAVLAFAVIFLIVVSLYKMLFQQKRESFENGMVWCNKKNMMVPLSECPCRSQNP